MSTEYINVIVEGAERVLTDRLQIKGHFFLYWDYMGIACLCSVGSHEIIGD